MLLVLVTTLHLGSQSANAAAVTAYEMDKVTPLDFNGDVRHLPLIYAPLYAPRPPTVRPLRTPLRRENPQAPTAAAEFSTMSTPLAPMPSPTQNFAGMSFADLCGGVQCGAGWPPDTNGDVGLNHYIQAVNDAYAIYTKTGTLLASFTENQLWSAGGTNPCNGDSFGDPIVLYDQLADRWILTHFAFALSGGGNPVSPFYQCIAASKTSDPVSGGWWLYPLRMDPGGAGLPPVGALNDYGKFGVWADCLYMAANEFQAPSFAFVGTAFASFSRSDLYSGAALTWALGFINNSSDPFTMIPSNLSGRAATALPAGTPNYFVSESQTSFAFEVRKFTAGPNCGSGGTLSAATNVSQTSYTVPANSGVVPQPGTSIKLDVLSDRLMQKVQYRKVGAAESLWVVHSVRTSSTSTVRPQWAQLDVTGGVISTTPVQQQIYAPDTALHRWMGSLAVDKQGNMALGYSTSNGVSPNFPSLAYSGRLATDSLNTLPQSEVKLIAGTGAQTNTQRWGDYSAMSVDPADDCTFWYTNEYYTENGNNWHTRIGSFKFPSCTEPAPVLSVTPVSLSFGAVIVNTTSDLAFTVQNTGTGTLTGMAAASGAPFSVVAGSPFNLGTGASQPVTVRFSPTSGNTFSSNVNFTSNAGSPSRLVTGQGQTFADVPVNHPFWMWIEALARAGITGGCATNPAQYCPENTVTRGQMAVFLLRGEHGSGYVPPAPAQQTFTDVPLNHPFASWIYQLAAEGITGGCATNPAQYCPDASVTRGQMAVFLLRGEHGPGYVPPVPGQQTFADVPLNHPFASWIYQLAAEGITGGCATNPAQYCPDASVTRGQMAVFLVRTFNLPL